MDVFAIAYATEAAEEVLNLRGRDRAWILDEIDIHLKISLVVLSRKRKKILRPDGEFIYQLRVGGFRVFYDVDPEHQRVIIRHIRRKGRQTTGEVL